MPSQMAIPFRLPLGRAGQVSRNHPSPTIEPDLIDPTIANNLWIWGQACVVSGNQGVRPVQPGDTAITDIYGITVLPWPIQASSATDYGRAPFGQGPVPVNGAIDLLRAGYILVPIVGTPVKGAPVFVWIAASAAPHIQGGFEAAATAGSTIAIGSAKTTFQGGADPTWNVCEVAFNI